MVVDIIKSEILPHAQVRVLVHVSLSFTLVNLRSKVLHDGACLIVLTHSYNRSEVTRVLAFSRKRRSDSNYDFHVVVGTACITRWRELVFHGRAFGPVRGSHVLRFGRHLLAHGRLVALADNLLLLLLPLIEQILNKLLLLRRQVLLLPGASLAPLRRCLGTRSLRACLTLLLLKE